MNPVGLPLSKAVSLGRYVPGASVVHRLDPRTKILTCTGWLIALAFAEDTTLLSSALVVCFGLAALARLPLRLILGNFQPLAPIVALTVFFNGLMIPGQNLTVLDHVTGFSNEGLAQGLFLGLRILVLVTWVSLLTLTTSPLALAGGVESLLSPFGRMGFPVHEMALTATIALRFIPFLADEAGRIYDAQRARGADFGGSVFTRARKLVPLLVPLFVAAYARADRLAVAMEARAYSGGEGRTRYRRLRLLPTDGLLLLVSGAGLLLLFA